MRKRLLKYSIVLIFVGIGLFISYYYLGIFTPYNYFTAKRDISNNKPRLLIFGMPSDKDIQSQRIAREYGFSYDIVAHCIVTESFVNRVRAYNKVTEDYLKNKFGENWELKFYNQVDSLYQLEWKMIKIVSRHDLIINRENGIKKIKDRIGIIPFYEKDKKIYRVDVIGKKGNDTVSFYRFFINPFDSMIIDIEKETIKFE